MKKRIIFTFAAALAILTRASASAASSANKTHLPEGWLLWHSYSDYSAMDSRLFLRSPDGEIREIAGDFVHPMNGSFGNTPADLVFMAIDEKADEWDIFRYDGLTGAVTDLTPNSGFRNEDPRFSPDGTRIVFKRGHWDHSLNDFRYDLAELDLRDCSIKHLTDDAAEEAMPCYSGDGRYIDFARYENGISSICRLDTADGSWETLFSEENVTAYYPVTFGDDVYFTKWHSADNKNDMIMWYHNGSAEPMPFNDRVVNCSDACPVDGTGMIYSSTAAGSYDLYYYDGGSAIPISELNTDKNELGASFYPMSRYENYLSELSAYLLGDRSSDAVYDTDKSGNIDVFDLVRARKLMT